jgi:hypothetical protein
MGHFEYNLKSLSPYTTYNVTIQCAVTCPQKRSVVAGPVFATTQEEGKNRLVIIHAASYLMVFLSFLNK